ncbi:MAG: hypothetical protein ACRD44_03630 [Bryobacteraceae bacterium]
MISRLAAFFLTSTTLFGQSGYLISTVAGVGKLPFVGHGGPATNSILVSPEAIAADRQGNFYFCDSYYDRVLRVTAA